MNSIKPNDLNIRKLTPKECITGFDCGDEDLNEFIKEDALNQMDAKINVTYLCKYRGHVAAFFTLSADSIKTVNISEEDKRFLEHKGITYNYLPALKLCQLAVTQKYKSNHIGTYLVEKVIRQALDLSENIGLRYITVDAYIKTHKFYTENEELDFNIWPNMEYKIRRWNQSSEKDKNATIPLYMDIHV